jgi:hypothetical protein
MKFNPKEIEICSKLFRSGSSTSEVQEYLMNKYNIKRSSTSNFVKLVRKRLGIYNSN